MAAVTSSVPQRRIVKRLPDFRAPLSAAADTHGCRGRPAVSRGAVSSRYPVSYDQLRYLPPPIFPVPSSLTACTNDAGYAPRACWLRPHVPPHDLLVLGAPALLFPAGHVPLVRQPALNRPA
jgi:hypothetical protein